VKKLFLAVALVVVFSFVAAAQDTNARAFLHSHGIQVRPGSDIQLTSPHACTVSHAHPCVYYGGDFNTSDPNANGYANENTTFVPNTWTYAEVNSPVNHSITASFGNIQPVAYDNIDPAQAMWEWRTGMSEGNGGTLVGSGTGAAQFTATGRICYGVYPEYELLTKTVTSATKGDNFFSVQPQCTNPNNSNCGSEQYYTSTTDGTLNAINGTFTVGPNGTNADGPFLNSAYFGINYGNWCTDLGLCTELGMSQGVLK